MNSLTDDLKRLVLSHVEHDDDLVALTAARPEFGDLVKPISQTTSKRLAKLHKALPESAAVLRYHRQAHIAYKKGTLFRKMREWQVTGTVTFSDHVAETVRRIQRSCDARRVPELQKVCATLVHETSKGTRKEKTRLLEMIDMYIDGIIASGAYHVH